MKQYKMSARYRYYNMIRKRAMKRGKKLEWDADFIRKLNELNKKDELDRKNNRVG